MDSQDILFETFNWIERKSEKQLVIVELVNRIFPKLNYDDKTLVSNGLTLLINMIYLKFNLSEIESTFWEQLQQNNQLDLRALLIILLPFIDDNENGDKKKALTRLQDIYLTKDSRNNYVYSNSQYNRCIRYNTGENTKIIERPYHSDYFHHNLRLLMMTIETICHKLYVNWVDIVPISIDKYQITTVYKETEKKFSSSPKLIESLYVMKYIDAQPGLPMQDIYNTISIQLFHDMKNYKWLIYDVVTDTGIMPVFCHLEKSFDFKPMWEMRSWSKLLDSEKKIFERAWKNLMYNEETVNQLILRYFAYFFQKYHVNSNKLRKQGDLKMINLYAKTNNILDNEELDSNEELEQYTSIEKTEIDDIINSLSGVPINEIHLYFYNVLSQFKRTWYYYHLKIKNRLYLQVSDKISGQKVMLTLKNVYNYCKSLTHFLDSTDDPEESYTSFPKFWISLPEELVTLFTARMYRIDIARNKRLPSINYKNISNGDWFRIPSYIKRIYGSYLSPDIIMNVNQWIFSSVRKEIINIIFESLIYHGLLGEFRPNREATDTQLIDAAATSTENIARRKQKYHVMKETVFNKKNREEYENNTYYYVTGEPYSKLEIKSKQYNGYSKKYFDFLTEDQRWTFAYAMNWVSQINFFHRYLNNRVILVTGATGVGKSSEIPKLLYYAQYMIDFNLNARIICTQPRIPPTESVPDQISRNMGIPINQYNPIYDIVMPSDNYYIQFKHAIRNHISESYTSFMRFVTDGTLLNEVKKSPFMTKPLDIRNGPEWKKAYSASNIYDILIVDEAHEHNINMDMILTFARNSCYYNNRLKLVIISATMDDDEPIYRRYYRKINDNRMYPMSMFIATNLLDRVNVDRRMHIDPLVIENPIKDIFLSKERADLINIENFVQAGIDKTIEVISTTTGGDIMLFMSGKSDIIECCEKINKQTPPDVICLPYYSELEEENKSLIINISEQLANYTRRKEDIFLEEKEIVERVNRYTYKRAIIVATNVAEASLTLDSLKFVIDTGYAKIDIYNPVTDISEIKTTRISNSSSVQRRGRVGRVSSGTVYYLYDQEKVLYNKTSYKIAEKDVKMMILSMITEIPEDYPIVSFTNDINHIDNLLDLKRITQKKGSFDSKNILYILLENPLPYMDILLQQYQIMPRCSYMCPLYSYFGVSEMEPNKHNFPVSYLQTIDYSIKNHSDYQYDAQSIFFYSRCYTGYYYEQILDYYQSLDFYLINPDENIIERDLYTGNIKGIHYSKEIDIVYYHWLMEMNDLDYTLEEFLKNSEAILSSRRIMLPKILLAIKGNKSALTVISFPLEHIPTRTIELEGRAVDKINRNLLTVYFSELNKFLNDDVIVKTRFASLLNELSGYVNLDILYNWNNILWYAYSFPYNIQSDVVAVLCMLETFQSIKSLIISKKKNLIKISDIFMRFFNAYKETEGDIRFLWNIWKKMQKILDTYGIIDMIVISSKTVSDFYIKKQMYLDSRGLTKIPLDDYTIMNKLYESGKLNTEHEVYQYISHLQIDILKLFKNPKIIQMVKQMSYGMYIDEDWIFLFLKKYVEIFFNINKKEWMYEYEIQHEINVEEKTNVIQWAREKLIFSKDSEVTSDWDRFYRIYLRAFSSNLIYNEDNNIFYSVSSGRTLLNTIVSPKIKISESVLSNYTQYLIYNRINVISDTPYAYILSPVNIDLILDINPIYYYMLNQPLVIGDYILTREDSVKYIDPKIIKKIKEDILRKATKERTKPFVDEFPDPNVHLLFE